MGRCVAKRHLLDMSLDFMNSLKLCSPAEDLHENGPVNISPLMGEGLITGPAPSEGLLKADGFCTVSLPSVMSPLLSSPCFSK